MYTINQYFELYFTHNVFYYKNNSTGRMWYEGKDETTSQNKICIKLGYY